MEDLLLAAKAALEFIQSIDGYENSVTAVNLRREIQAVEQMRAADLAGTSGEITAEDESPFFAEEQDL